MPTVVEESPKAYAIRIRDEVPAALAESAFDRVIPISDIGVRPGRGISRERASALVETGFAESLDLREWASFYMGVVAMMFEDGLRTGLTATEFRRQYVDIVDPGILVLMCADRPALMRRVVERADDTTLLKAVELGEEVERRNRPRRYREYLASPE